MVFDLVFERGGEGGGSPSHNGDVHSGLPALYEHAKHSVK